MSEPTLNTPPQAGQITGYRNLSPEEIALMNTIKAVGNQVGDLVSDIDKMDTVDRRWVAIARTHLQEGFMALTRSVAKPESF